MSLLLECLSPTHTHEFLGQYILRSFSSLHGVIGTFSKRHRLNDSESLRLSIRFNEKCLSPFKNRLHFGCYLLLRRFANIRWLLKRKKKPPTVKMFFPLCCFRFNSLSPCSSFFLPSVFSFRGGIWLLNPTNNGSNTEIFVAILRRVTLQVPSLSRMQSLNRQGKKVTPLSILG